MFNATNSTGRRNSISQTSLIEIATLSGMMGVALLLCFFGIFRCLQQKRDHEAQNSKLYQADNQQNLFTDSNQRNLIP